MTDEQLITALRIRSKDDLCRTAADRMEALVKERDEATNQLDSARHSVDVLEKRVEALVERLTAAGRDAHEAEALANEALARAERLEALLREARSDLEVYVGAEYPQHLQDKYPSVARQYQRDMELCRRIDAALAALRAGDDA